MASLISTTRELDDAKANNSAIDHADEVKQIADANAKKVETLMTEVTRPKALLDSELSTKQKRLQKSSTSCGRKPQS